MSGQRSGMTRRAVLAGLGGVAAGATAVPGVQPEPPSVHGEMPVRGKAGPGLEPLDAAMREIMDRHGIPGAALAIAKGGKLLLAKGYGWADVGKATPVEPTTRFGLASLSKTITALATLKLVEQGKLGLDDKVLDFIPDIRPAGGGRVDPRLTAVTVRHCLNHSVGWDRTVTGDPINWEPQICRAFKARPSLTPQQFLSYMLTVPLQFDPGTDIRYCNVGYVILGEVIARRAGMGYERFAAEVVWKPVGVTTAVLEGLAGRYLPREAIRHLAGTLIPLPPATLPMVNATGGWVASAVDLVRLLSNLDGSRGDPLLGEKLRKVMIEPPPAPIKPRPDGTWVGLGWDIAAVKGKEFGYFKDGSYQGMRTYMKRLPNGINWALLFNASMEFDPHDVQLAGAAVQDVLKAVEGIDKHPDVDLFDQYR